MHSSIICLRVFSEAVSFHYSTTKKAIISIRFSTKPGFLDNTNLFFLEALFGPQISKEVGKRERGRDEWDKANKLV